MTSNDDRLLAAASQNVSSITGVVTVFETIQSILPDGDGLKWFNWLYLTVTKAVDLSAATGTWHNTTWLVRLDVNFASLYLSALRGYLTGAAVPECWAVLFRARNDQRLARLQFAFAGMNAHIDRDLCVAVNTTCAEFGIAPVHLSGEYQDFCAVNSLLDGIVNQAKQQLLTGLLGQPLPCLPLVENLAASFGLRATREAAWTNAEMLWASRLMPGLADRFLAGIDRAAALAGAGLLAPVGV